MEMLADSLSLASIIDSPPCDKELFMSQSDCADIQAEKEQTEQNKYR